MSKSFDAAAARAMGDAVRELEARSAAELVVEVRARSGSYAHADGRFAAVLSVVSLIVIVFMPWVVPPIAVVFDAVAFYLLGLAIAGRSSALRRLFTSRRERTQVVRTHAAALYHDRGIGHTAEETGLLLYVSLLERRMEVLADRGLLRRVNATDWNAVLRALPEERAIDAESVLAVIRALTALLQRDLPAGDTNIDELGSAPEMHLA